LLNALNTDEIPALHPVSLHFSDPVLEHDYQSQHAGWVPNNARLALLLATGLIVAFGFVDPLLMPESVKTLFVHRLTAVVLFTGLVAFTFHPLFKRHNQKAAWLAGFVGGYAVLALPALVSLEHGYIYYVGVVLAPAFFFNLLGLRFLQALMLTLVLLITYNAVVIAKGIPFPMLLNNNLFVLGISVVTAASGYVSETQNRTLFYQSHIMKSLKEHADEASEARARFFANMSHELRTPLNAIIGYNEMLLEDARKSGNRQLDADLSAIDFASHQLLELINDVLDLAKIDAGKVELKLDTIRVSDFLQHIQATATPLAKKNNNRLVFDYAEAPAEIRGDSLRLQQVLNNLISNACKFTQNGDIVLRMTQDSRDAVFEVVDTGMGIGEAQMQTLFDEYQQAHAPGERRYGGTGLGLAISQRLAKLMGGIITVQSTLGQGSRFTFRLPV